MGREAYRANGLVRQFRAVLTGLGVSERIVEVSFVSHCGHHTRNFEYLID
jgi:hypothetical protein